MLKLSKQAKTIFTLRDKDRVSLKSVNPYTFVDPPGDTTVSMYADGVDIWKSFSISFDIWQKIGQIFGKP